MSVETKTKNNIEEEKMKTKLKLSFSGYRSAVKNAFISNMMSPSIFWNPEDGFYVRPDKKLVPNTDLCLGLTFYDLNNGGAPNFSGTRREYTPIARGIRKFYAATTEQRTNTTILPKSTYCEGQLPTGEPCNEWNYGDTCSICGYKNSRVKTTKILSIEDFISTEKDEMNRTDRR